MQSCNANGTAGILEYLNRTEGVLASLMGHEGKTKHITAHAALTLTSKYRQDTTACTECTTHLPLFFHHMHATHRSPPHIARNRCNQDRPLECQSSNPCQETFLIRMSLCMAHMRSCRLSQSHCRPPRDTSQQHTRSYTPCTPLSLYPPTLCTAFR